MDYSGKLKELLNEAIIQKVSDLHISVNHPPILRISGQLIPLMKREVITAQEAEGLAFAIMTEDQKKRFLVEKEIDFSYAFGEEARFRVNVFFQKGYISCALRSIQYDIMTIEQLSLPPVLHEFVRRPQGFFLVTGPSGQGKSTTLAAMVDEINHTRAEHMITIEDPIEYLFKDDRSVICQREVHQDTNSFAGALKAAFRQDLDVMMIGEMRDPETMSTAITIAETGHLVFATLHTNSTAQSIHRIVDSFPAIQQSQIRAQLSGSLIGIMAQRLVPRISGGLVPACEILINTPAVANLIRENKIHEIPLIIDTSAEIGMISLNRYLANLVRAREIDVKVAQDYSLDPSELRNFIKR
jgi:twitching motility protein PilT